MDDAPQQSSVRYWAKPQTKLEQQTRYEYQHIFLAILALCQQSWDRWWRLIQSAR